MIRYLMHRLNDFITVYGFRVMRLKKASIEFMEKNYTKDKELKIAEIGVFRGINSKVILDNLNVGKLYLIDPYKYTEPDEYSLAHLDLKQAQREMKKRLRNYTDKINLIEGDSLDAVKSLPNDLDYVYLDGNHSYAVVSKEMVAYWEKLKAGGILAGHDAQHWEITKAIIEFTNKTKLTLHLGKEDWWVIKNENK